MLALLPPSFIFFNFCPIAPLAFLFSPLLLVIFLFLLPLPPPPPLSCYSCCFSSSSSCSSCSSSFYPTLSWSPCLFSSVSFFCFTSFSFSLFCSTSLFCSASFFCFTSFFFLGAGLKVNRRNLSTYGKWRCGTWLTRVLPWITSGQMDMCSAVSQREKITMSAWGKYCIWLYICMYVYMFASMSMTLWAHQCMYFCLYWCLYFSRYFFPLTAINLIIFTDFTLWNVHTVLNVL